MSDRNPLAQLTFEDFRRMAQDTALSCHEKVGFPDSYREGYDNAIFADIRSKLTALGEDGGIVLEIGPGCGPLPLRLIELCRDRRKVAVLIDSSEMLSLLPDAAHLRKLPGQFPQLDGLAEFSGRVNAVLAYSVLQYPFQAGCADQFLDAALALLCPGGQLLLGDLPNQSMRRRYFGSAAGQFAHRRFTGLDDPPPVDFSAEHGMDDEAVIELQMRARQEGYHAWLMPQAAALPMANRREDLLIVRP